MNLFAQQKDFATLKAMAENGDVEAYYPLSLIYQYGNEEVEADNEAAYYWAKKAADFGNANAMVDVGIYNIFFQNNFDEAKVNFTKASKLGNPEGYYMLGYCYASALYTPKDVKKAIQYYKKAVKLGSDKANYQLGMMYYSGNGVKKDINKAFKYISASAQLGHASGQSQLSYFYQSGIGVEKDELKSYEYAEKAAVQGNERGLLMAGLDLVQGKCVEQNFKKGISYINYVAENGTEFQSAALYSLGLIYETGWGCPINEDYAREFYQASADMNYGPAKDALKRMGNSSEASE